MQPAVEKMPPEFSSNSGVVIVPTDAPGYTRSQVITVSQFATNA